MPFALGPDGRFRWSSMRTRISRRWTSSIMAWASRPISRPASSNASSVASNRGAAGLGSGCGASGASAPQRAGRSPSRASLAKARRSRGCLRANAHGRASPPHRSETHVADKQTLPRRHPTGIPGLDLILEGGLLASGVYIVQGPPGAGKTILANQACFHHAANGGRALYVTLLAESHSRMFGHLRRMAFFDERAIPDRVYYIGGGRGGGGGGGGRPGPG